MANVEKDLLLQNDSAVNIVDEIIKEAIKIGASDIHIESGQSGARLRYRIDGVLYDQAPISENKKSQVISRVKVLSNINLAQRRLPQDGKFLFYMDNNKNFSSNFCSNEQLGSDFSDNNCREDNSQDNYCKDNYSQEKSYTENVYLKNNLQENISGKNGFKVDLRVSTFPSIYGEKVVIRILDRSKNMIKLDALGFNEKDKKDFLSLLQQPSGFVLVTGPTGSGKTTTLYAALSHLNKPDKNIITLEDPVEYNLDGITQGQIHPDAGFTFAKGIRAILRQDPDIAMVGEIRDKETAQTAIEASLTGHQVFSTLHTNDAPGAIMRLMDMGVEPFLLNAALTGVLAQRLGRKICQDCKVERKLNSNDKEILSRLYGLAGIESCLQIDKVYFGTGCQKCFNLGNLGRVGIFELLKINEPIKELIIENPRFCDIRKRAIAQGMRPLAIDGLEKVKSGLISIDELARVIC